MEKITKENSPFQTGVTVALIRIDSRGLGPRRITKKMVDKVYKTGKFYLVNSPGLLYQPVSYCGKPRGETGNYSLEHIELWTPEIEAEIEMLSETKELDNQLAEIKSLIAAMYPQKNKNKIMLLHYIAKFLNEKACEKRVMQLLIS